MNVYSVLWIPRAWCFSMRASVATVLTMHPCVSRCLRVNGSGNVHCLFNAKPLLNQCWDLLYPSHNELVRGVYWFHSVRLSICLSIRPTSRVCSVALTVLVGSISYLYILSSNFRRCVACKFVAKFLNLNCWQFFKICNFDFVLFWLGIWCKSLVWVIMGQRGISERRLSSCSSFQLDHSEWSSWIF